jgi:hypothetical protein
MAKLSLTVHYGTNTFARDTPNDRLILVLPGNMITFRVLEPYAVKVVCTVLRRESRGNIPDLSDGLFNKYNHDKYLPTANGKNIQQNYMYLILSNF